MLKKLIIYYILLFPFQSIYSQLKVTGKIVDDKNAPISKATVLFLKDSLTILHFLQTDSEGNFELNITEDYLKQIRLIEINLLSYQKQVIPFQTQQKHYSITLKQLSNYLNPVTVTPKPRIIINDTLNFAVDSFAIDSDRSIGDVLKRLPGVSVMENGEIYYNGKKVSNLYIDGDDLMSGRYGLATKAINKKMIQSIDIIRNHEDIKVLREISNSDEVAFNLKLKDPNQWKLAGNTELELGIPNLYRIGITPILLNQKIKAINSIKLNNLGDDYAIEKNQLGNNNTTLTEINQDASYYIDQTESVDLNISKQNYFFNQSQLISTNNLYNFKSGFQLKTIARFIEIKSTINMDLFKKIL